MVSTPFFTLTETSCGMPRTSGTRFVKLESFVDDLRELTCWNFGDETKFVDIEDFWSEAELATRDVVLFREDMLLSVSDFVIDYLTWSCCYFVFTENQPGSQEFSEKSIHKTHPTTSILAFISSRRHFCVFGRRLNLIPQALSNKQIMLKTTTSDSLFIVFYLFLLDLQLNYKYLFVSSWLTHKCRQTKYFTKS